MPQPSQPPARSARRAALRGRTALAAAAALLPALAVAPQARAAEPAPGGERAAAFTAAAAEYHVPLQVLLGVSYLETRWDAHGGAPSTDAGYGPMHLTDAAGALAALPHHGDGTGGGAADGTGDPRGKDDAPQHVAEPPADPADATAPRLETLAEAALLTGATPRQLRTDPAANIRGGAALLAAHQADLGEGPSADPAAWYGAVARYSGADDEATARQFADEVFEVIAEGQARQTDAGGGRVALAAAKLTPRVEQLLRLHLRHTADGADCPATLGCEWVPAPYQQLSDDPGDYGNHDLSDRPFNQKIDYIVIHDTETLYDPTLKLVQDPTYVSWHYTIRSADGHVANHVDPKDAAWHAGNWYVNAKSVGIEHEGFLAQGGQWYTEAMYRSSAKLVRYLAGKYGVPLDRAHVVGHDDVPGTTTGTIPGMHQDPGPYWDWDHYFDLLGRPFRAVGDARTAGLVTIDPDYAANTEPYYCGDTPADPCPVHGSASITLRTAPRDDAPLVTDIGIRPTPGDWSVYNHAARVSTGQQYAVADRSGDWTAIWYLGQQGWFRNPAAEPTALPALGLTVVAKPGRTSVPVYGRAYPEASAYPAGITPQAISPLPYRLLPGQRYALGGVVHGEYYYSTTFDPASHTVVRGTTVYYQVQFGQRFMFVNADDVRLVPSWTPVPTGS
ncbi:N-acetylmuramoyl-L-alanine amidase [Kitasatospora sp. SolWspMP-SS2h]|uniref:N-acetylmuramoyl-L-alanine amidase n=1 Tax=Kitasatospora sp. SolWspMP-SS2h TaxID=1305729 RepID=UPI000DBA5354|nr:peptidoglycan recognition family protein [Kitasatospora sp. SolWspMP-SS2h]RAJ36857.1 N-acetylmuramoyl-L-alanine amidase [Kitasatospora sp. SolWspMP-SS2h]